MKKKYTFDNENNFINDLKTIDITVPLRSQGRKQKHVERYSIVILLKFLYKQKYLDFPFTLIHRDKPDFSISYINKFVGIEVTEAIPEQLARAQALCDEYFPKDCPIEPEFFGWGSSKRSKKEILKILKKTQKELQGESSFGKSIEGKWIQGIKKCVKFKTAKLNKKAFKKYKENWLLIYDNQSSPSLDKKYVSEKLGIFLSRYCKNNDKIKFDKIFIEYGIDIFVLDYKALPRNYNISSAIL